MNKLIEKWELLSRVYMQISVHTSNTTSIMLSFCPKTQKIWPTRFRKNNNIGNELVCDVFNNAAIGKSVIVVHT